mmetsp:Transcript_134539/g.335692  ORF Transcript_134539/g.335692 Transcript_134539/m.335692 type:complete len:151 (-) Transcript_134539:1550-2002(-)
MVSKSWTVLKRCAIATTVMLVFEISSIVSWINISLALSKALVASSKNNIFGLRRSARAIAMRCFCPPENCEPPDPTKLLFLEGKLSKKSSCAAFIASFKSSCDAVGKPYMMFSSTEVAKSTGSCPTYPIIARTDDGENCLRSSSFRSTQP